MMGVLTKPYEWAHPQFDPETHRQWVEFEEREPYVKSGLRFIPPSDSREQSRHVHSERSPRTGR